MADNDGNDDDDDDDDDAAGGECSEQYSITMVLRVPTLPARGQRAAILRLSQPGDVPSRYRLQASLFLDHTGRVATKDQLPDEDEENKEVKKAKQEAKQAAKQAAKDSAARARVAKEKAKEASLAKAAAFALKAKKAKEAKDMALVAEEWVCADCETKNPPTLGACDLCGIAKGIFVFGATRESGVVGVSSETKTSLEEGHEGDDGDDGDNDGAGTPTPPVLARTSTPTSGCMRAGEWHVVTCNVDCGAGEMTIYVDGCPSSQVGRERTEKEREERRVVPTPM